MGYLDEIDATRDSIGRRIGEKVNKTRAKIIIGRDHDEKQVAALRSYNSHLNRVEIITFDQLASIARHVVSYLERVVTLDGASKNAGQSSSSTAA